MARRRRREADHGDEAAMQLAWARYVARVADLADLGRSDVLGERYTVLSADDLADLTDRYPGHPASRQIEKHLELAADAEHTDGCVA